MSVVRHSCLVACPTLAVAVACLLGVSATCPATGSVRAQEPAQVSGAVSCETCTITLDTIASIGGIQGKGLGVVTEHSVVAVDGRGRFLLSELRQNEFSVFDSSGKFIRTVGRQGDGPGEYQIGISQIAPGPRFIHVFENHRGRTLLDHEFNVVRTDRFPGQVLHGYAYVTDSEGVVMMADIPTPNAVGHNFHILRHSGEMISFGGDRAPSFHVTGNAETMWALQGSVNRVVRWRLGAEPQVSRTIDRTVEAFDSGPRDRWPGTGSGGIKLDEKGRLWIRWFTPDSEWIEPKVKPKPGQRPLPPPPLQQVFDNYLDVFDPRTGRTLARHRSDGLIKFVNGYGPSSARYVYAIEQNDAGVVYLHLMVAGLERAPD